jgi:hypothetical protein
VYHSFLTTKKNVWKLCVTLLKVKVELITTPQAVDILELRIFWFNKSKKVE